MIEKRILRFCAMSHSAIRKLSLHIFARIQCLFSYLSIFLRKKFRTLTKIHHFVSTPFQIFPSPQPRSYLMTTPLFCESVYIFIIYCHKYRFTAWQQRILSLSHFSKTEYCSMPPEAVSSPGDQSETQTLPIA